MSNIFLKSIQIYLIAIFTVILFLGCSSGGGNSTPVVPDILAGESNQQIPDLTENQEAQAQYESNHYLMLYNLIYVDPDSPDGPMLEVIPMREGEIHLNILKLLEDGPCTNCFMLAGFVFQVPDFLNIDIQIKHPINDLSLSVFDVRGIMMFQGSHLFPVTGKSTSDPALGDWALLNADGYTALYNGLTISAPVGGFQKFYSGNLATATVPNSIVNGYKYYVTDDPLNDRNAFFAGSSDTQTYWIKIPTGPFVLGYAVDASWWPAIETPVDDPLTDFDTNANCPEPWKIVVTEEPIGTGLNDQGGQTKLLIDVYDWQGKDTYHDPIVECSEIFDGALPVTWVSDSPVYSSFEVTVSNTKLASVGNYMCLVKVEADENDPIGKPWLDLSAYSIQNLTVIPFVNQNPVAIAAADPNPQIVGNSVHLFDDGSYDPDGGLITKYEWDFGADGTYEEEGSETWYEADTPGIYSIQLRITDDDGSTDLLDTPLEVEFTEDTIHVTAPDGDEHWKAGTPQDITWDVDPDIANVKIELSTDSGDNFNLVVAPSTPNTGVFPWNPIPPGIDSDTCRIKISDVDCPGVFDESDSDFEIFDPWINVTSPNGGENLEAYMDWEITWDTSEIGGTVNIEYSKDDFAADLHTIAINTPNDGSYMWENIPFDLSDTVRIRIFSASPLMSDASDDFLSIVEPAPFVRILTPNGGEQWGCGSSKEITWWSYNVTGNVDLYYSKDNFVSDNNLIVEDVPFEDSYMWFVPLDMSYTVRVKAIPVGFPSGSDVSDSDFSIVDGGWARTWGAATNESLNAVVCDANGNSYTTGEARNVASGYSLAMLQKHDPAGELIWSLTWGFESPETYCNGAAIALDDLGYLYVTGYFRGEVDFDPTTGFDWHASYNASTYDVFVSKFDTDGTWYWTKTWGGSGNDLGLGIGTWESTVYVAGEFSGADVDFNPDPLIAELNSSNGGADAFLSWFDTSGNFDSARTWGGVQDDRVFGVAVNDTGTVFATGAFRGSDVNFDQEYGSILKSSNGSDDAFLCWFEDWDNLLGVETFGTFYSIDMDFDPGPGSDLRISEGWDDAYLTMIDSSGNYVMARTWGDEGYDEAYGLSVSDLGVIFVAGFWYSSSLEFAPVDSPCFEDSDIHINNGEDDAFLVKYMPDGCW
ncbi:MAG: PKD domain-containing protein [bacterium]|nr:PKD domain-containing protein [bacterium]